MTTTASLHELEHYRDRVRLYLKVMFLIDVGTELVGAMMPLFIGNLPSPEFPGYLAILRWTTTAALGAGWAFTQFARPGRAVLIAVECALTIGLTILYGLLTSTLPVHGPSFALLCTALSLVARAALVPSPVSRTLAVGVTSVASVIAIGSVAAHGESQLVQPVLPWLAVLGGMFVVATAVTSHVIYGLHRQVRRALRLGQYELGRKLGQGGMGVVYEATHVMLRRPTAVKLLPIEKIGEHTVARFEREVQQTSRLEHPNSVYIYDYGRTPDGLFYYAMEHLDGVTLEQLIEIEGPLSTARAVHILQQAARALAEAHAKGLIHRDIKPANVMLCERALVPDTVKVLDFGLVKELDNPDVAGDLTNANTLLGTPHYLAPEAITQAAEVGPASDVYALGAVGFFLVTGREVFTGSSVIEVCSQHLSAAPPPPSSVAPGPIDPAFEALILRCLKKQPDERPNDGGALAEALDRLDLPGWTLDDARAWWQKLPDQRACATEGKPVQPTQFAVDVEARRR